MDALTRGAAGLPPYDNMGVSNDTRSVQDGLRAAVESELTASDYCYRLCLDTLQVSSTAEWQSDEGPAGH